MSTESVNPSPKVFAATPNDAVDFVKEVRQLYIGTAGDVTIMNQDGTTCTFKNVLSGSIIGPFFLKKLMSTGTTASNIVAFN